MSKQPDFIGTWKGEIIKAIAVDGAKTWEEIRETTKLSPKNLNIALQELHTLEIITKQDKGNYRVEYALYKKYTAFYSTGASVPIKTPKASKEKSIIAELADLNIELVSEHAYLFRKSLQDLSIKIVEKAKSEILIVNPFFDRFNESQTLIDQCKNGVSLRIFTHAPKKSENEKKDYYEVLTNSGAIFKHNKNIHAKVLIVVMNLL